MSALFFSLLFLSLIWLALAHPHHKNHHKKWNPHPGHKKVDHPSEIYPTIDYLPISNGLGSGWVDVWREKLVGLRTQLYGNEDENTTSTNWCYDSYFGVYQQNSDGSTVGSWLPESTIEASWEYLDGTNIVSLMYDNLFPNLKVRSNFWLPFTADSSFMVMTIQLQNFDSDTNASVERDLLIHSLFNFLLGSTFEETQWETDPFTGREYYSEVGNLFQAVYFPLPSEQAKFTHEVSPFNVYSQGGSEWVDNVTDSGLLNSTTSGFQWQTTIYPNQELHFGLIIQLGAQNLEQINDYLSQFSTISADSLLQAELDWWSKWHQSETLPQSSLGQYFDPRLFRQSTAVLKMAQNRESGPGYGQILASLPPGMWDIGWVRDGAYSSMALSLSNHHEESKAFLNFLKNSDVGYYKNFWYNGEDRGVGVDYGVSVCRYFGNGKEWSDGGSDPNIELDGFGLILTAVDTWFNVTHDLDQIREWWDWIANELVNPLLVNIDPENQVIIAESGIWERHLSGSRHFSDTTATALAGLNAACHLATELTGSCPANWVSAQQKLYYGFYNTFTSLGWVKGESEDDAVDGSAIESFNLLTGLVDFDDLDLWINTTSTLIGKLPFSTERPWGYKRRETGEWYDVQEWVFVDLRIAAAQRTLFKHTSTVFTREFTETKHRTYMSVKTERDTEYTSATESWLLEQAQRNAYVLPELFDEYGYAGAIPMAGFGAGAWIILQFVPYE